jgi:hypothetical protein
MSVLTPFGLFLVVSFLVVAVVAALVSVGVLAWFVASSRRERLTRHESVRTYYRGLAFTH